MWIYEELGRTRSEELGNTWLNLVSDKPFKTSKAVTDINVLKS